MSAEVFTEQILVWLGPVPLTRTMVSSAATSLILVLVLAPVGRAVARAPSGRLAAAGRLMHGFLTDLVTQAVGRPSPGLERFAGSLFLFIAGAALLGQLPGVVPPTANLAATSSLAALVFLAVPIAGVRARGPLGYVKHYFQPNPLLFPLHLVSELSRTLALALRLFGNMMSGHLIVALIVALVGLIVPVPLMALDLLIGLLQAYIFTILASVYIGAAIRVGEED
ncbi:F0F1 ATP synthase subunit A [Myxococcus stipitatus]|uniref:F0F1 ATP synthase subunit A n=1 Tax=Myxococcus stipitatus TaxID=83455 RepID=UPI0030CB1C08